MNDPVISIEQRVTVMQIIAGALISGVLMFGLILYVLSDQFQQPAAGELLSLIAAGSAAVMWGIHHVLPAAMAKATTTSQINNTVEQLCTIYQGKTVVSLAMLEGAAFFNLVAYFVEHNWWTLVIVAALVLQMLIEIPTVTRVKQWIETQQMNRT